MLRAIYTQRDYLYVSSPSLRVSCCSRNPHQIPLIFEPTVSHLSLSPVFLSSLYSSFARTISILQIRQSEFLLIFYLYILWLHQYNRRLHGLAVDRTNVVFRRDRFVRTMTISRGVHATDAERGALNKTILRIDGAGGGTLCNRGACTTRKRV